MDKFNRVTPYNDLPLLPPKGEIEKLYLNEDLLRILENNQ
jgi:hypothetical protein